MDARELRLLAALLAVNVLGFSVIVYGTGGTDVYVGDYLGRPVYYYFPDRLAIAVGLAGVALGLALLFGSSLWPDARLRRALLAYSAVVAGLAVAGAAAVQGALSLGKVSLFGGREDSYVMQLAAAQAVLEGRDPYLINYAGYLLSRTQVAKLTLIYASGPPPYSTSNVVGFVTSLDYPAMSFLYYVPAVALHVPGNVWDSLTLAAALALLYWRLGPRGRAAFPALASASAFYFITDPAFFDPISGWLAPSIAALAFWDSPALAGALLGLAASYRQYAAALLVVYAAYLAGRRGRRAALEALGSATASAAAVNAPFLAVDPRAFLRDVVLPGALRLDRQGLGLSTLLYLGVYVPRRVEDALVVASLAALAYVAYRVDVRWLWPSFAGVPFLFYPRPFYSYWLWFLYMSAAAALLSLGGGEPSRGLRVLSAAALAASMLGLAPLIQLEAPAYSWASWLVASAAVAALALAAARPRSPEHPALVAAALLAGLALVALSARPYVVEPQVAVAVSPAARVAAAPPGLPRPADLSARPYRPSMGMYVRALEVIEPYGSQVPPLAHYSSPPPGAAVVKISGSILLTAAALSTVAASALWPLRDARVAVAASAALPLAAYIPSSLPGFAAAEAAAVAAIAAAALRHRGHGGPQRGGHDR